MAYGATDATVRPQYCMKFGSLKYIKNNKVEAVLPSLPMEESAIFLLYSDRVLVSNRVKVFINFLIDKASSENIHINRSR